MKVKVLKRLIALVMSALLMLGASVSAFATEVSDEPITNTFNSINSRSIDIPGMYMYDTGMCPSYGNIELKIILKKVDAIKQFYFTVSSPETDYPPSGGVYVRIYNPYGSKIYEFDAYPRKEEYYINFNNPTAGEYTIKIESGSHENLFCTACWVNG